MKLFGKQLIWQDFLIVAAIIFQWATLFMTRYYLFSLDISMEYARQLEANPVMREVIDKEYAPMVLNLIGEGVWLAMYIYIRKKMLAGQVHSFYINTAIFIYFIIQSNAFANDFGIFLKLIMGG
jgi:hypothetical protein